MSQHDQNTPRLRWGTVERDPALHTVYKEELYFDTRSTEEILRQATDAAIEVRITGGRRRDHSSANATFDGVRATYTAFIGEPPQRETIDVSYATESYEDAPGTRPLEAYDAVAQTAGAVVLAAARARFGGDIPLPPIQPQGENA